MISGKGQFICGNKACQSEENLKSWEVNFSYVEKEVKKNCLIKLSRCRQASLEPCNIYVNDCHAV